MDRKMMIAAIGLLSTLGLIGARCSGNEMGGPEPGASGSRGGNESPTGVESRRNNADNQQSVPAESNSESGSAGTTRQSLAP